MLIRETGNKVYITTGESAIIVEDNGDKLMGNAKEYNLGIINKF